VRSVTRLAVDDPARPCGAARGSDGRRNFGDRLVGLIQREDVVDLGRVASSGDVADRARVTHGVGVPKRWVRPAFVPDRREQDVAIVVAGEDDGLVGQGQ
jgi:hypothetical protein